MVLITVTPTETETETANFQDNESCSVIEALWLDILTAVLMIWSLDSKWTLLQHIKLLV